MITVKEIAKMCDVSPSTVSNILNGKTNVSQSTRERVLEAVKRTGYQPNYFAANMRKQNTRTIGIIAEDFSQFSTTPIVEAASAYLEDQEYRTISMNLRLYDKWKDTWYDDRKKLESVLLPVLNEMQSIKVDGLIYVAGHCRPIASIPADFPIPAVISYAYSEDEKLPSVLIDDEQGGYEMMRYFLNLGHRKVAIIAGVKENLHTIKRLAGCRRALQEAGIEYDPSLTLYGNWERESGYQCAQTLWEQGMPKAIWCMNDKMAGGVYDFAREKKIEIGKELAVAGCDDLQIAEYLYPKLTTNELPLAQIGVKAAQLVLQLMNDRDGLTEKLVQIPGIMKIRESVSGPRI